MRKKKQPLTEESFYNMFVSNKLNDLSEAIFFSGKIKKASFNGTGGNPDNIPTTKGQRQKPLPSSH